MGIDPTQRFTGRAGQYAKYRPTYPPACINFLQDKFKLGSGSTVADIGSGTGIFTGLMLGRGCTVYGVEPNRRMAELAKEEFGGDKHFISVSGTGEDTTLASHSVDLVTVAQAFHWLDPEKAKVEFTRILKDGDAIALLWNIQTQESGFAKKYEALKQKYGRDYLHIRKSYEPDFALFFSPGKHQVIRFPHSMFIDREGLVGLMQSSSYMPTAADADYGEMIAGLHDIFDQCNTSGRVEINYETHVHVG